MANTNIINAVFGSGLCAVTTSAFRANYGMKLRFSGIDLPTAFEVDFSNYDVMGRDSITAIGQNGEVQIPDDLWDSGLNIYAFVYLHPTDDSGVTVYTVTIPVLGRPNRTDETPTPHEQTVIEQAISALNDAVEQTAADVASADASAQAAAQSEANASVSERSAAASASAALASQNAAESAAQSATESASGASESARNAANSASQAAESATSAQESAEQAESSVQSIGDDVERSERAAATATGKATEAASSATAAAQSASSASTAAQNAASSATAAESSATDAETAKQDAQDAQTAAEQAAQSVSGLSAQIAQNTADIADLVQTKAGALIDTVSGSIASFVPDATIPTVKGLTVDIEPVQEGSGDPSPYNIRPISGWDAVEVDRTGVNLWGGSAFLKLADNWTNAVVDTEAMTLTGKVQDLQTRANIFEFPFKQNTKYTIFVQASVTNTGLYAVYTDGAEASIATTRFVSNPNKTLAYLRFYIATSSPITFYANGIGVFEGDISADDFNPYLGQTYQIQLGQTVYGGTIDVTGGKMVVDRGIITLDGSTYEKRFHGTFGATSNGYAVYWSLSTPRNKRAISNLFTYSDESYSNMPVGTFGGGSGLQETWTFVLPPTITSVSEANAWLADNSIQIVTPLATPIEIPLTPLEISVLTGQTNNIWADSGDVSVEYAADLKTYIDQKIAAAVAALS